MNHVYYAAKNKWNRLRQTILYRRFHGNISAEFDRIYHIHIRKCAGTSMNVAFIEFCTGSQQDYGKLAEHRDRFLNPLGRPVVGWNKHLLAQGAFFYGFSHIPFHRLDLPPKTFTFTFFRDPAERVVSHFRMLKDMKVHTPHHEALTKEGSWADGSFSEFLEKAPRFVLQNQLFMFDGNFNINRAIKKVTTVSFVGKIAESAKFVEMANSKFSLDVRYEHKRKSEHVAIITEEDKIRMRALLREEYEFLERVDYSRSKLLS